MVNSFALPSALRYGLAAFYAYGAAVHVANMLGWTGFDWFLAPVKWQMLDVMYLVLDVGVVAGLLAGSTWAVFMLVLAATSQVFLYTIGREWVLNVPAEFAAAPADMAYLNGLVVFHVACLAALGAVFWTNRQRAQLPHPISGGILQYFFPRR